MDEVGEEKGISAKHDSEVLPERFSSNSTAAETLGVALPSLVCPTCRRDKFVVADEIDNNLRTRLSLHAENRRIGVSYYATLSVICDNCGYILIFEESKLKELAEQNRKQAK